MYSIRLGLDFTTPICRDEKLAAFDHMMYWRLHLLSGIRLRLHACAFTGSIPILNDVSDHYVQNKLPNASRTIICLKALSSSRLIIGVMRV